MKNPIPYFFLLIGLAFFPRVAHLQDMEITLKLTDDMDFYSQKTRYGFADYKFVNSFETFQVNTISATYMVCNTNADCDDGIACTTDICNSGTCQNVPDNGACSDGQFCNGEEICSIPMGGCISASTTPCSECQTCNEGLDQCDNLPNGTSCSGGSTCLNGACQALPVELMDFYYKLSSEGIRLTWRTASETQNAHFLLQHSTHGRTFQDLAQIPGQGNSQQENSYEYLHEKPSPGTNYYRLKQVDFDGNYEYSKVISVDMILKPYHIFPNPNQTGELTVQFSAGQTDEVSFRIFDSFGKLVLEQFAEKTEAENGAAKLDMKALVPGIYILEARIGATTHFERVARQ